MTTEEQQQLVLGYQGLVAGAVQKTMDRYGLGAAWREDLSGAGNLGLVQAAARFDPGRGVDFANYAFARVRGAVMDELRAGLTWRTAVSPELPETPSSCPDPEQLAVAAQSARRLGGAVESLPEKEREVFRAHHFEGLQFNHIATAMGLSKGAISKLHARALQRLGQRGAPGLER